jgi:SAM-dependent methyltransferase
MNCRHCGKALEQPFLDLGHAPPSNAYLRAEDLDKPEVTFPLRLRVCDRCWLVQTEDYARPDELFGADYAYFSSTSSTWLEHAKRYCDDMRTRFALDATRFVVEIGSNDGYLLRHFLGAGISCLGIEPTASTAAVAEALGIHVEREFFGSGLAQRLDEEGRSADLIGANNVYAHVPDINDFTAGLKRLLKHTGILTLEFPHVMRMIERAQFDTAYHEHFSYLSLCTVMSVFAKSGLRVFDVEELSTHGGSLRVFGCHADDRRATEPSVAKLLAAEEAAGLRTHVMYRNFQSRAERIKDDLLLFLIEQKRSGRCVAGYGAAAKGNTLLNYAGVRCDLLPYVCDAAALKQGKFLPGSHIPILAPSALAERRPDVILILPWNIANEIVSDFANSQPSARFVAAIPELHYVPVVPAFAAAVDTE